MFRKPALILLACMLLLTSLTLGCRKGSPILTPSSTFASTSSTVQLSEVKRQIMLACVESGWTAYESGTNTVEAKLVVRGKHTVVVDIPYTQNSYQIVYKNSINMEHSPSKGVIHPNYNKWVNTLNANISKKLSLSAIR